MDVALGAKAMIHLIHGIRTQGPSPVQGLIKYLQTAGFEVRYPDYGWIDAIETRIVNPIICGSLLPYIGPQDLLIGHSNGCAIAYDLMAKYGAKVAGTVFINGALEQDIARFAPWYDVYFNRGDDITRMAKIGAAIGVTDKAWGQLGHAGYSGGDPLITNIDCGGTVGMPAVSGHSDFFTPGKLAAWAPFLVQRIRSHLSPVAAAPAA
jgi:hypothetical protein